VTEGEARELVARLLDAFPQTPPRERTEAIFVQYLRDLEYAAAAAAVGEEIACATELPTVGAIRSRIFEDELGLPRPLDAWRSVVERGGELHPLVADVASRLGGTFSIRTHDQPSVVRAQFLAAYGERREEEKRRANLASLRGKRRAAA
jgi:hypothetical protein